MAAEACIVEGTVVGCDAKKLYNYWLDGELHAAMTGSAASPGDHRDGNWSAWGGFITGTTTAFDDKKLTFSQKWRTQVFPKGSPDSVVVVEITAAGPKKANAHVKITHTNMPAGQGKDYENGWSVKYLIPANAHFEAGTFASKRHWHKDMQQLASNLWVVEGIFRGDLGKATRTMTIFKMPKTGGLCIHGPAASFDATMKQIDDLGPVEIIIGPCDKHRADLSVWKARYPKARVLTPAEAKKGVEEVCPVDQTCEAAEGELKDLGIRLHKFKELKGELVFEVDADPGTNAVGLVFADICAHHTPDEEMPGPQKLLLCQGVGVIRGAVLPAIGFCKDKKAMQQSFFKLADSLDPRVTSGAKKLTILCFIHGPAAHAGATDHPYTDALWTLRQRIAIGKHMPESLSGGVEPCPAAPVKDGELTKSDPKGKNWKARFAQQHPDARITYREKSTSKSAKGYVDLKGALAKKADDVSKANNPFQIVYPRDEGRRTFLFATPDAEEREAWIASINQAAKEDPGAGATSDAPSSQLVLRREETATHLRLGFARTPFYLPTDGEDQYITQILDYWFHMVGDDATPLGGDQIQFWFMESDWTDSRIRASFSHVWEEAVAGKLADTWTKTTRGLVALVILLDQFSRNLHRGAAAQFQGDELVRKAVDDAIASGEDQKLPKFAQLWLYLSLQRQEAKDGSAFMPHYERLAKEAAGSQNEGFWANALTQATQQADLLQKFGRFPVRNEVLGRESTPEEAEYLASGNQAFSTGKHEALP